MTRVVHVMASGEMGGGATHLLSLLPGLREQGVQCELVVGWVVDRYAQRAAPFPAQRGANRTREDLAATGMDLDLKVDIVDHHCVPRPRRSP